MSNSLLTILARISAANQSPFNTAVTVEILEICNENAINLDDLRAETKRIKSAETIALIQREQEGWKAATISGDYY